MQAFNLPLPANWDANIPLEYISQFDQNGGNEAIRSIRVKIGEIQKFLESINQGKIIPVSNWNSIIPNTCGWAQDFGFNTYLDSLRSKLKAIRIRILSFINNKPPPYSPDWDSELPMWGNNYPLKGFTFEATKIIANRINTICYFVKSLEQAKKKSLEDRIVKENKEKAEKRRKDEQIRLASEARDREEKRKREEEEKRLASEAREKEERRKKEEEKVRLVSEAREREEKCRRDEEFKLAQQVRMENEAKERDERRKKEEQRQRLLKEAQDREEKRKREEESLD